MIGILGGTFDPIHHGHLHVASQVYAHLDLQQLQFMPCAMPVHRDRPHAAALQRCAMIELAIAGHPGFVVNSMELERAGPSYSIDSLRQIRSGTDRRLILLMGSDAFNGFADWKEPDAILALAHLVVCHRPGVKVDRKLFHQHRVSSARELRASPAGAILTLEIEPNDCSSSSVRASLSSGGSAPDCLDPVVASYIEQHHLYRSSVD